MKIVSRTPAQSSRRRWPAAIETNDPVWWRWTAIAVLLSADLAGVGGAREVAFAIAAYQALEGLSGDTTPRRFRSQVRMVYLCAMGLSFVPVLEFIAWIQMVGTWSLVLTGYCPLARVMVLLPFNRPVDLSWALVRQVVWSPATTGSIVDQLRAPREGST
ncbi:hypothetical protein HKCCE3408_01320 [Rhodobacterales bacterium HKCCE3408]|nr:hypothetical protein [Rhodobacterales bacterium HKCCE3408]